MTPPKTKRKVVPEVEKTPEPKVTATPGPGPRASVPRRGLTTPPTAGTPRPVPIPTDHHLDSGLVDYGMWVERSAQEGVIPRPAGTRRGRIWA
ncbi:hypothetical protein [Kineosporia succinea]|uniref:Uncharacterized protein n=1 Tax=Kineosporia succinea TaxID=84632 RepID=A0ABT9PCJ0_9ACTN|nr:hypothetical protein [Kineosporia succinea]MDP9830114.1 hypothetical protein [Kineosporia succinea]